MHFQINHLSVAGEHSGLEEVQAAAGRHKLVLDVILIVRREDLARAAYSYLCEEVLWFEGR